MLCTYNDENTIVSSVESLLNQTYQNIEILVLDDGSTDATYEVLLQNFNDNQKIQIFKNNENIGLTKSLNKLIKKSKGSVIARQDADDTSVPNRLEIQMQTMNLKKLDFCTSRAFIKNSNRLIPNLSYLFPPRVVIKYKNPFIHGTLFIKKSIMLEIGCYDEQFKYAQDYKLFIDLLKMKKKFYFIKKPLYILNMEDNISSNFKEKQKYYAKCAQKNLVPDNEK
jgi:glycosyltransferase involved in cell wall biosynthesis